MTTRDEFAKAALTACVREFFADPSGPAERAETGWPWADYDDMAQDCYAIADAMMRAREPKPKARNARSVKAGAIRRRR